MERLQSLVLPLRALIKKQAGAMKTLVKNSDKKKMTASDLEKEEAKKEEKKAAKDKARAETDRQNQVPILLTFKMDSGNPNKPRTFQLEVPLTTTAASLKDSLKGLAPKILKLWEFRVESRALNTLDLLLNGKRKLSSLRVTKDTDMTIVLGDAVEVKKDKKKKSSAASSSSQ